MTPRAQLGNHVNPMVRAHGLAECGGTCAGCQFLTPHTYSRAGAAECGLRGRSMPRHRTDWDACALVRSKPATRS